ncbi:hypothetical protein N7492_002818 [Penicillium capsulatum]|uniref:Uncharacterized protein n=1 Tax=Penicillium capsulatum TaxID=69766 RepID=A0A9W9II89_9EURO|nr:hypothetical protein N7492_002818 [Penicillium capsulatum]KAJ6122585.1 hypothetical protein N7512_005050 [Penicillium capsulatum]
MSTQSPHPPTPKGSRNNNNNNNNNNNRRTSKKNTTPQAPKAALLNTPPSSPPRNMSPSGVATDTPNNVHSKKKPPRSGKKPNTNRASPAPNIGNRHVNTPQQKDSAAYAGPTFHASPAPSALPIPSFFSKSLPESDLAPTLEADSDTAEMEPDMETTPSKPRTRPQPMGAEPQGTPLDFLFKAAVQARNPNTVASPEPSNHVCSPQTDSKALHNSNATPGGMFAFEMDNSEHARASPIGPSFATPYQDRMNAYRSASTPSQPEFSQEQRQAKTAELKHLLLNPRPQKPPSSMGSAPDSPGNYGSHPNSNGGVPHYATPARSTSGPPGPRPLAQGFSPNQQPMPNNVGRPLFPHSYNNRPTPVRNANSPLRREVPVANPYHHPGMSSPSRYANQYPAPIPMQPAGLVSPPPHYASAAYPTSTNSPTPSKPADTKKMEDDLRRILKLDAAPGIQSSFA